MNERVSRDQWKNEPLVDPAPLLAPTRIWTDDEMARIRLGYLPAAMEHKWFAFMEGDRLYLHRSWTGYGIYEADFVRHEHGYLVSAARVTSDNAKYRRGSDDTERARLEQRIAGPPHAEVVAFGWACT